MSNFTYFSCDDTSQIEVTLIYPVQRIADASLYHIDSIWWTWEEAEMRRRELGKEWMVGRMRVQHHVG